MTRGTTAAAPILVCPLSRVVADVYAPPTLQHVRALIAVVRGRR